MAAHSLGPIWIDAQLPPSLGRRLASEFGVEAIHVAELALHRASDAAIFEAARAAAAVVLTKDIDFVYLLERHGPPPRVVWVTCGNVGKAELWSIVRRHWRRVLEFLEAGEPLIELG